MSTVKPLVRYCRTRNCNGLAGLLSYKKLVLHLCIAHEFHKLSDLALSALAAPVARAILVSSGTNSSDMQGLPGGGI